MWIFIPSSCVPELECSEKASEPHSSTSDESIEPFVTWSGKPVPPANLPRLWKRERSIRRLSGLTLSRSTAQHGADAWIASLPDFHARTYQSQASARGSTASDPASSSTSPTSPMLAVRDSSFWRTSQASLLPPPPLWTKPKANSTNARPPESWENWPTAGGMRSGRIYARPTSVPTINVTDGFASHGAWLTPNVPNGGRSVSAEVVASRGMTEDGKRTVGLESEVRHWATPDANAMERINRSDSPNAAIRPTLALAAAQWATPKSSEADRGVCPSELERRSPALSAQTETWATPTARDHKDGATNMENVEVNGLLGRQVLMTSLHPVHSIIDGQELSPTARTLRRRLNPAFACWLMGWPIWWTNPAITNSVKPETELWRSKLQLQLSRLLGEQTSFEEAA